MTISSLSGINTLNLGINTRCSSWSHGAKYRENVQNASSIYQNAVIRGHLWSYAIIFTPGINFCGEKDVHEVPYMICGMTWKTFHSEIFFIDSLLNKIEILGVFGGWANVMPHDSCRMTTDVTKYSILRPSKICKISSFLDCKLGRIFGENSNLLRDNF